MACQVGLHARAVPLRMHEVDHMTSMHASMHASSGGTLTKRAEGSSALRTECVHAQAKKRRKQLPALANACARTAGQIDILVTVTLSVLQSVYL